MNTKDLEKILCPYEPQNREVNEILVEIGKKGKEVQVSSINGFKFSGRAIARYKDGVCFSQVSTACGVEKTNYYICGNSAVYFFSEDVAGEEENLPR